MNETSQEPRQDPGNGSLVPPYFAFKTLLNQLDFMKEKGIPARIDRSFLVGMSGAGQAQYITGLRSLGLIDASGTVTPRLTQMVNGSIAERKGVLREILADRYAAAIDLGRKNATTGQLVELFREEYGATGDTARKAIAFFLNAARYAGDVPLSPMFQTPKVSASRASGRRPKRTQPTIDKSGGLTSNVTVGGEMEVGLPRLHPAIAGVLGELPPRGRGWTEARREEFLSTFKAVVNFTVPVLTEEEIEEDERADDEESGDLLDE